MKLKKIASLALAGVMAVSMLAGCGTDSSSNSSSSTTTTTTASIINAINNGQDSINKVKITFTANSKLQDAAEKVSAMYNDGYAITRGYYASQIAQYAGILPTVTASADDDDIVNDTDGFYINSSTDGSVTPTGIKDGQKKVYFNVVALGSNNASTAYLMNAAAAIINGKVAQLDDTTMITEDEHNANPSWTQTPDEGTYYDFTYTGSACMYGVTTSAGVTNYFMAYTITQTAAEKTL